MLCRSSVCGKCCVAGVGPTTLRQATLALTNHRRSIRQVPLVLVNLNLHLMASRILRAAVLGALSLASLGDAYNNYSSYDSVDMMRAQLALMEGRPKECPPWYVVIRSHPCFDQVGLDVDSICAPSFNCLLPKFNCGQYADAFKGTENKSSLAEYMGLHDMQQITSMEAT